jgi:hypothetical protein
MRLNQSAGLAGLKGIPSKRDLFLRPFLQINPREIDAFIEAHDIPYWEDPTNLDLHYQRNHVRFEVNHALEKVFHQGWAERFAWSAYFLDQSLSALNDFLAIWDQQYLKVYPAFISYELSLIDQTSAIQQQCLIRLISKAFASFLDHDQALNLRRIKDHVFRLQALWIKEKKRQFQMELPYELVLTSTEAKVKIYDMKQLRAIPSEAIEVDLSQIVDQKEYIWGIWAWQTQKLQIQDERDLSDLKDIQDSFKFEINLPKSGAIFSTRLGTHKKIRHLWGDLKSSIVERAFWPVLQTNQGDIIYAPDLGWSALPISLQLQKFFRIEFFYHLN